MMKVVGPRELLYKQGYTGTCAMAHGKIWTEADVPRPWREKVLHGPERESGSIE